MRFTRRRFLGGAAAAALGGAGIYELVDQLSGGGPARPAAVTDLPPEQHVFDLATTHSEGTPVLVPPLHSEVVTASLHDVDLRVAKRRLDDVLETLDATYEANPAGLGVTVAWGLPYFARVHDAAQRHLPFDRRAQKAVLLPTRRFPSDPHDLILEENDVAFLLRSDSADNIAEAHKALTGLDFLQVTSIRRGFAGGGFDGKQSLPKRMAMAAGLPSPISISTLLIAE